MSRQLLAGALALGLAISVTALADDDSDRDGRPLVRFDGGIGSQPLRSGGTPNVVQGVNPGGIAWVIGDLRAVVRADGRISVDGRGLLLAGGNNVGTPGGPRDVSATLFCSGIAHDSDAAAVAANGDFRIDSPLYPAPADACASPVLLIRSNSNGVPGSWFAAGILVP